jgi:hypothetical protein
MSELDTLTTRFEARLGRLERNYRRMTMLATMFASLAVIAVLTGQSPAGPTIVGNPGGARTTIAPDGVRVYDSSGVVRLDMTIEGPTPGFGVHGTDGKYVVAVDGGKTGGLVQINDASNNERAYLGVFTNGGAGMQIYNGSQKIVAEAISSGSGGTGFFRAGDGTTERAYLGVFNGGRAGMQINNAAGKIVIAVNEGTNSGGGFIDLSDATGTDRAYLGLFTDNTSGGWTRNASGTQTWHAP